MILDRLDNASRYYALHPGFRAAFEFLAGADWDRLPLEKHEIDGLRLFVLVARDAGRGHEGAPLESHRRYIDIQYVIDGDERMGWRPLAECSRPTVPFDADKDIGFFGDSPSAWFDVRPGSFVTFYPEDAHAPLAGTGRPHKAVVKVAVDWQS